MPTRNVVVASAATVSPTSGAHWSWKWSGITSDEYPSASAARARSRHAAPSLTFDVITPKRIGWLIAESPDTAPPGRRRGAGRGWASQTSGSR